jgi:hypothetical protein
MKLIRMRFTIQQNLYRTVDDRHFVCAGDAPGKGPAAGQKPWPHKASSGDFAEDSHHVAVRQNGAGVALHDLEIFAREPGALFRRRNQ